jgi:uncharacterized membrane protein YkvA (DUF1232 family)
MRFFSRISDWLTTPYAIYLVIKDPAVSRTVKWRAAIGLAVILAYVISPFDVIPDFIPLSGWLDDLIVIPLGLMSLRLFIPGIDIVKKQAMAQAGVRRILFWTVFTLTLIILLGMTWLGFFIYLVVRLITS